MHSAHSKIRFMAPQKIQELFSNRRNHEQPAASLCRRRDVSFLPYDCHHWPRISSTGYRSPNCGPEYTSTGKYYFLNWWFLCLLSRSTASDSTGYFDNHSGRNVFGLRQSDSNKLASSLTIHRQPGFWKHRLGASEPARFRAQYLFSRVSWMQFVGVHQISWKRTSQFCKRNYMLQLPSISRGRDASWASIPSKRGLC